MRGISWKREKIIILNTRDWERKEEEEEEAKARQIEGIGRIRIIIPSLDAGIHAIGRKVGKKTHMYYYCCYFGRCRNVLVL